MGKYEVIMSLVETSDLDNELEVIGQAVDEALNGRRPEDEHRAFVLVVFDWEGESADALGTHRTNIRRDELPRLLRAFADGLDMAASMTEPQRRQ